MVPRAAVLSEPAAEHATRAGATAHEDIEAEPADAAAIADAADAEALKFAGLEAMCSEDPLLNLLATLGVKGKNADGCPAEDSENSDEDDARKLRLFDGMTPEDTTRLC